MNDTTEREPTRRELRRLRRELDELNPTGAYLLGKAIGAFTVAIVFLAIVAAVVTLVIKAVW